MTDAVQWELSPHNHSGTVDNITAITAERGNNYGHPRVHFLCTQSMYSSWLAARNSNDLLIDNDQEMAFRHAVYMMLDKLARMTKNPIHKDNWDDIQGYAKCGMKVLHLEAP